MQATYSPEDNKLRLYSLTRLDAETYESVKAHGFKWAPKQDLFVAPKWTPGREDLLIELCGEIGDEDTSLTDRAEQRAERFDVYSEKRLSDAHSARASADAIADGIPMGQPILVGHHSERHARRDAEKIDRGMRKAVKMWETSKYWEVRAAGAIRHAKYKELPRVRANRIKKIEADRRRQIKSRKHSEDGLALWTREGLTLEQARHIAGNSQYGLTVCKRDDGSAWGWSAYDVLQPDGERWNKAPGWTVEQVQEVARRVYPLSIAHSDRWIAHYDNRLTYEKAMLEAQGAVDLLKPKARPKQIPICNYRAPDGIDVPNMYQRGEMIHHPQVDMTKAEFAAINKDYKGTRPVDNSHRVRVAMLHNPMRSVCVFLTDSKTHTKPEPVEPKQVDAPTMRPRVYVAEPESAEDSEFRALKETAKAGVQVVAAPQLFLTPNDIAARMVEYADIETGHTLLEPSAGTGRLLMAVREAGVAAVQTVVEINSRLCDSLKWAGFDDVRQGNFLECDNLGTFDRVIMNPPFKNGDDIKHIRHALTMLKPGGKLVALCADGPRQNDQLQPLATHWEQLPSGTFAGTGVRAALMVIDA